MKEEEENDKMNHLEKQEKEKREKREERKRGNVMEMKRIKRQKGITLVALVVTIVVLLILAGITITALFGENGIISQAQKAKTTTEQDETNTQQGLKDLEEFIEQETINIEDWEYEVDETTNTITITKYRGNDTEVVIPNYINGIPVKRIENRGEGYYRNIWDDNICDSSSDSSYGYEQETITKVKISDGIEQLGTGCFAKTINLKEIIIPNSVKSIGGIAFGVCRRLTSATIPNGVISISQDAFIGCKGLTNVTIPSSVTSMEWRAFENISPSAQITCNFPSKPSGWDDNWTNCTNVVWAGTN